MSARKSPKKNTANTVSPGKIAAPNPTSSSPDGEFERAGQAADFIFSQTSVRPRIALVLGSGLGAFADEFAGATKIPYAKIPRFPQSTAIGHAGKLVIGKVGAIPLVGMQGRVHLYEGYSSKEVAFPISVFARMGVKAVILTNAAGGIKREFVQGRLVVISDHINLQGVNPLIGPNDERFGLRFHDMTSAYDRRFREMTVAEGNRMGIAMHEGVYAGLLGPSYETPAEIRAFARLGADAVGMSTAPETIVARQCGMKVAGLSCITNLAAGRSRRPLSHAEVLGTGERVRFLAARLLKEFAKLYAASDG